MGKHCNHEGVKHLLTIGKCRLYVGGYNDVVEWVDAGAKPKLAICLMGNRGANAAAAAVTKVTSTASAKKMLPFLVKAQASVLPNARIVIEWPDMGAPTFNRQWWEALLADLWAIEGDVVMYCHGGHGRTGTAAAILTALTKASGLTDPVVWVRQRHCIEAVETTQQIQYLRRLDIKTNAVPSRGPAAPAAVAGVPIEDDFEYPKYKNLKHGLS